MFYPKFKKQSMIGLILLLVVMFFASACGNADSPKSTKSANGGLVTKDSIVQYFSRDLGFKFGKEIKNAKGNQVIAGEFGKPESKQYVYFEVISNSTTVKGVVMTVWLNGENSVNNRDLVYISKLIEKVLPDIENRDEVIKQGLSEAFLKKCSSLTINEKILEFSYVTDAGGEKSENAIIFGYDTTASPQSQPTGQKIDVTFNVEPKITAGNIQITGTTNLPNGTALMFSLSNGNGYSGQTKAKVMNGSFSTESFSNKGGPLDSGIYNITISTPYAFVQDESIQKILGKHGEMLMGQYVHSESGGNIVTYKTTITVR